MVSPVLLKINILGSPEPCVNPVDIFASCAQLVLVRLKTNVFPVCPELVANLVASLSNATALPMACVPEPTPLGCKVV